MCLLSKNRKRMLTNSKVIKIIFSKCLSDSFLKKAILPFNKIQAVRIRNGTNEINTVLEDKPNNKDKINTKDITNICPKKKLKKPISSLSNSNLVFIKKNLTQ